MKIRRLHDWDLSPTEAIRLQARLVRRLVVATIGCAKSRLSGTHLGEPRRERGSWRKLSIDGEEVGRVLRTRDGVKPLYVSPGHRSDVAGAGRLVLATGGGYRLPEPTRLADQEVARLTKGA